ncbi:hypothetical protein [Proteiniborus sp.]|uniref:hypothetical protein n=1 Tax=Proteiniborus sp. TaxID=2079015 RepID=UPI003328587E
MSENTNANSISNNSDFNQTWVKPSIKIGIATVSLAMVFSFLPNIYLYIKYGVFPPLSVALRSWLSVATIFGAFYFVEPFSYYPILGMTGSYIGILSGNISNVRLPASATAQAAVGVKTGSKQGEIISTLGIAGSVITNLFFLTIAVLAGSSILNVLPGSVKVAFEFYTLPAIFGALYGQFAVQQPKIAVIALPLSIIVIKFTSAPTWLAIIIAIFGNILISRLLYKKGILK